MTSRVASPPVSPTLAAAQAAARRGDRRLAHDISVQIVVADPTNEPAWLLRAGTADSLGETIDSLGQLLLRNPGHRIARRALYEAMQHLLRQDAFLAYVSETGDFYFVRTRAELEIAQPKDRAQTEAFPPPVPPPTRPAFRWLGLALVGLVPAGLGTLVCAPMAALAACRVLLGQGSRADRRAGWVVLWTASTLWLVALLFLALLVLHFV